MSKNKKKKEEKPVEEQEKSLEGPVTEEKAEAPEKAPEDGHDKALEEAQAKAEEYLNLAQRVQADFDNFRRRNAQVRAEAYEDGARELIKTILPVVDNLERALESESSDETLHQGVDMTYRMLMDTLTKRGVKVISRKGEVFDPRYENAVMRSPADSGEPGTVSAVLQKGYMLGDSVIRFAMVQVVEDA